MEAIAATSGQIAIRGGGRVPTDAELELAAVELAFDQPLTIANEARKTLRGKGPYMYRAHVNFIRGELEDQVRATATGDYDAVREMADEWIEECGFQLPVGSEGYVRLCELLNDARLAQLPDQHQRNVGEAEKETTSPLVRRVRARQAAKAEVGETLLEQFELWAAEQLAKGKKRPDTVDQDRKVIRRFSEFVGIDRAVDSITPIEVAEYRDTLRKLPPKWMSKKELRSLDMRAAAALARKAGMAQTAFTNINKHLSTISPLYTWLAKHPRWAGLQNPVNGLFYDGVKGMNPRPPFKTEELNKILGSPLFTGFLADGKEHLPGNMLADDWRKWIPLVCLFTGARLGEIAQLRIGDVRQEHEVWVIHIRHEAVEGLSTKSGRSRFAAVHPVLRRIGFLAFHRRQLEVAAGDESAPLFPGLHANARGQISGTPSDWWRGYLGEIAVKDHNVQGGDGFGTHSFRHTLADRLRVEGELLDNQVGVCLGHSVKSVTGGYGRISQGTANMLKGWIEGVRFDGVNFDHLIATGAARDAVAPTLNQPHGPSETAFPADA